ncbi:MAG: YeeE/YedE family protein [Rhizobiaceae bacterium]|nr:YeeE/YedE family protein [Rhizobiaceae bacterium]
MTEFTPWFSLAGGFLIGLSSVLLMLFHGRIAGMTGIVSGLIPPIASDWGWRVAFVAGAILAPAIIIASGSPVAYSVPVSQTSLVVGGIIVGLGVFFSSGCTSGHGVCGLARFSIRSLAATVTFMAVTFITVYVIRHVIGA